MAGRCGRNDTEGLVLGSREQVPPASAVATQPARLAADNWKLDVTWCGNVWSWHRRLGRHAVKESVMSVYRVIEVIGTSSTSWEEAAAEAVRTAAGTIRDLRVAEVVKQDIHLEQDGAITYRTKLQLSFKYEQEH